MGPGLWPHPSPPASSLASNWLWIQGKWRPAQFVPAAVRRSPHHWRPSARAPTLLGPPGPGSARAPQPFPLTLGLGSPGGKGPGLPGRQPAVCARQSPHLLSSRGSGGRKLVGRSGVLPVSRAVLDWTGYFWEWKGGSLRKDTFTPQLI